MRKLLALLLLLVLGLPSALPLVAASLGNDDAGLPACCRRAGKHHCAMSESAVLAAAAGDTATPAGAGSGQHQLRTVSEPCPYRCALVPSAHPDQSLALTASLRLYAEVVAHPAVHAQTESRWRLARDRARGKRGPPAQHLG